MRISKFCDPPCRFEATVFGGSKDGTGLLLTVSGGGAHDGCVGAEDAYFAVVGDCSPMPCTGTTYFNQTCASLERSGRAEQGFNILHFEISEVSTYMNATFCRENIECMCFVGLVLGCIEANVCNFDILLWFMLCNSLYI